MKGGFRYTKEDFLRDVREAFTEEAKQPKEQPAKPNILEMLRSKKELGESKWPLV